MKCSCKKYACLLLFSMVLTPFIYAARLSLKPTFESCSLYLSYDADAECKVSYRKVAEKDWHAAYTPIYDGEKLEFRGSIVRLEENTDYTVKAEIYSEDGKKLKEYVENFKTWNSTPPISNTIHISTFKNPNNDSYDINKVEGTPTGWIKIVGDQPVNAQKTTRDYAISVTNSRYIILEGITVSGGGKHGIFVDRSASDIRIINCDISQWGRASNIQNENGVYIDNDKTKINNDAGIRIERTKNIVVERCYIHDSRAKTNPWAGIIQDGPHKGTEYKATHPEGPNGIHVTQALEGIVLRYNDVIGSQTHRYNDPIETAQNGYVDGGFNRDADIYGNVMAFGQDDGIELDGAQCNIRMFNNRIEQTFCGISTAPNRRGPSYIFNNLVWNLGNSNGVESVAVKNGGDVNTTRGRQFFFNNTMYVTQNGINGVGYGRGEKREMYYATTRNNILVSRMTPKEPGTSGAGNSGKGMSISDIHKTPSNDFDHDMLGNTKTPDGRGTIWAAEGAEANGIFALPQFNDQPHGVFTLKADDKAIDSGIIIPNFTEKFHGKAPDMGAIEYPSASLFPIRPLNITADKYLVKLKAGRTETITLSVGEIEPNTAFDIRKSNDMAWLTVTANAKTLNPGAKVTLTLNAVKEEDRQAGMIIVRLKNGLSVPITVFVN